MKRLLAIATLLMITTLCAFGLVACGEPAHTHVFNKKQTTEEFIVTDATCTAKAKYYYSCECGAKDLTTFEYGEKLQHSFTNYVSNNDAKCGVDGTETAICDHGCNKEDTRTEEGSAVQHSFTNYISDNNATCGVDGTETATCDHNCGETHTRTKEGSAVQHSFTNYISDNNATYEADGTKTATCDNGCGTTDTITDENTMIKSYIAFKTFEIEDNKANIAVRNSIIEFDFKEEIEVIGNVKYIVGLDKNGTQTSITKVVDLNEGDNIFYVFQMKDDEVEKTYIITIHRNYNYIVSFEGLSQTQTIEEGYLATTPTAQPTKLGYTFIGWDFDFNTPITGNITINAKWMANTDTKYIVEYYFENINNTNYTKDSAKTKTLYGTTDTTANITAENIEHFTFNSALSTTSGNINGNGSLVLKLYYNRNTYTVKFNGNGGTLSSGKTFQTVKYDASATAPSFVRTGYSFTGFDKAFDNVAEDIIVTAKWQINQYTLTFVLNNGEEDIIITQDYNTSVSIANPTRTGYTLAWDRTVPITMPAEDLTINAKWQAIFNLSGGTIKGLTSHGKTFSEIVIPESIDGIKITSIGSSAFEGCRSLTSIEIPNSVTSIGKDAFEGCRSLTYVNYMGTVDSWAQIEFVYYESNPISCAHKLYIKGELLTTANITSATKINAYAFGSCDSLTSVTIGDSVTSIGDYAFAYCTLLRSIEIPNSVTGIGYAAFFMCTSLQYNIEGNLKYLGNSTNKYLYLEGVVSEGITTANINNNCKLICSYAFAYCTLLRSIEIPNSVTWIGDYAFEGCTLQYNIEGNLKYLGNSTNKYLYLAETTSTNIITANINNNCKFIGSAAFADCNSLTNIVIPDSVVCVGEYALVCDSLTSITVEENNNYYKSIDGNLYSKDGKTLIRYAVGKTVTTFSIPSSVINIYGWAFAGCNSLTNIVIPDSVVCVGEYALGCASLTTVFYKGGVEDWSNINIKEYGNEDLIYETRYYYIENESDLPDDGGNYWHYVDGVPTPWTTKE